MAEVKGLTDTARMPASLNCITGGDDHLYGRLRESISKASKISIIVSFLMESGVRMISDDLAEAAKRGARIRILCGNYLNITQPQALYLLKGTLGDGVDLRFYDVERKSFHPKAYIFESDGLGEIFVGSSNISRTALTDGIEWNYRFDSIHEPDDFTHFKETFEDLFLNRSRIIDDNEMKRYSRQWKRPKVYEDIERLGDETDVPENVIVEFPSPVGAQIEALYELKRSRSEGWDKGLVVAATGLGKTYLAAFDSREFRKILFVAHREEILSQSERTFRNARPDVKTGFFKGDTKDMDSDVLFASVQTLGRKEYLTGRSFSETEFDYIVIDEFHHAVSENYQNIIGYFKPKFLLGLTATPERLDNQDVFALCDYNVIYEARLKEAINKGWLSPFRYYGIFDETDYSGISCRQGKYDEKQLEEALSINKRAGLVLENYGRYRSSRALGFCAGRKHAVYMAEYFSRNGIKACAVVSGDAASAHAMERSEAIRKFRKGEVNVLFSVDMFNEGLDVPDVDMVMLLRPTESPTVFLQQLGRGLRKSIGKKYVNVLDFIGNYRKANLVPFFLTGSGQAGDTARRKPLIPDEEDYPEGCFVNFDLRLIDLFRKLEAEQKDAFGRIVDEYFRIKEQIGERPSRLQMFTYLDDAVSSLIRSKKELNIFRDYLSFLDSVGEAAESERSLIGTKAHLFIREMENTSMSKLYKMPVLLAFHNGGKVRAKITDDDIYESFREFYTHGANRVDMLRDKGTAGYMDWGRKEYVDLARKNPLQFLQKTSPEFFNTCEDGFCLNQELWQYLDDEEFTRQFGDVISFKTRKFYKERLEKLEKQYGGD
ncbi:DEAD/DEAH box helicase family protein [Youngiibacter multivorans]|uniref:Superfamily II DNA or RNA helicase n=1 Tax=Youngiibacter multivorans TaxID=937251 RepID=A0ABS4G0C2_9CLOT|nr:DEAD/DEAH box helicase family protein [Youngiibacter multivorans]MBP1918003.1 superfamily II DNA or RNA helicase [Youngiibacter multivorans]